MFYTGGLPFNFARNPHYRNSYAYAATHSIQGYVPWEQHFCKKKELMLKDFWNQLRTFGLKIV